MDTLGDDYILIPQDFGMIPESASGLEPEFDISYYKRVGNETAYCNP